MFEVVCKDGRLGAKINNNSTGSIGGKFGTKMSSATPGAVNRRRSSRGPRSNLSGSVNSRTLAKPSHSGDPRLVFAMKCLRPTIRNDPDQFIIGSEDLVHETAILASLNHKHIIKVHGRASGTLADAFVFNDGYFILLDKLNGTLHNRIDGWKEMNGIALGPKATQI